MADTPTERALRSIATIVKSRATPSDIKGLAKHTREVLLDPESTDDEKDAALRQLKQRIDRFLLAYAKERPPSRGGLERGALPVPDDTPWAVPRRRAKK